MGISLHQIRFDHFTRPRETVIFFTNYTHLLRNKGIGRNWNSFFSLDLLSLIQRWRNLIMSNSSSRAMFPSPSWCLNLMNRTEIITLNKRRKCLVGYANGVPNFFLLLFRHLAGPPEFPHLHAVLRNNLLLFFSLSTLFTLCKSAISFHGNTSKKGPLES